MKAKATKIIRLEAENLKRLRAVAIEPDGSLVVVSGRNAQGKSSVLDAIWMALGGQRAFPRRPVRDGAEQATIRLELEELIVERRIKPDGKTSLVVSSREGARYPSPQSMLDALVGSLSFDPLAFARMDPRQQRELLRELVGLDTSAIDEQRAELYDERTVVNREAKRLEGEVSGVPHHPDAPAEAVSVAALTEQLHAAEEHQRAIDRAEAVVERAEAGLQQTRDLEAELVEEIAVLEKKLADLRARLERGRAEAIPEGEARLAEAREHLGALRQEAPDRETIREQLAGAEKLNAQVRDNHRREELKAAHAKARAESERLTKAIKGCDEERARMVAEANYPLPGLSVDEQGVLLDGVPLEQASSAEQLRASVAIGLALNPSLRVLLVRDGSLLDEESLRMLGELASEADAQVWLEMVSRGEDGVGVVIEDGAVRGAAAAAE